MQQHATTPVPLPMYFGDFGGIFVPDAFTPDFFDFARFAGACLPGAEFSACLRSMVAGLPPVRTEKATINALHVEIARSQALFYMVAGHLALAKLRGSTFHYLGAEQGEIALFAARLCRENGMHCHITLSSALSQDTQLKETLSALGAEWDGETCEKLYDRPQAYAFQRYLGDRAGSGFIPVGANLGAYPYPALSGYFGGLWGARLRAALSELPDTVAATMLHGNAAVAAFRAFPDLCRATVERPVCQQYHGEFCGCSLLMARTADSRKYAATLAPELTNLWRMAQVVRLGAEDYCEVPAPDGIRAETARAADIISRRLPEARRVLIVEGENE